MKSKNRKTVIASMLFAVLCLAQTASAFYAPELQRWVNRDLIEESGGLNIYGFVDNEPIANFDPTGLAPDKGAPQPNEYGDVVVTCTKVPGGRKSKTGNCLFECICPSGYYTGYDSKYVTRPCKGPLPTRTCVPVPKPKPSPWEVICGVFEVYVQAVPFRSGRGIGHLPIPKRVPTMPPPVPVTP